MILRKLDKKPSLSSMEFGNIVPQGVFVDLDG